MNKKVTGISEKEFINEVADDCIRNLREKDKTRLIENPCAIDYHFSYCMYIRNHYIHNRDFSEAGFWAEPDQLSSDIIRMIFSKLLPEYDYDDLFIEELYENKKYIQLRKEYKAIYGDYPVFLTEKYRTNSDFSASIDRLVHELAELVWRTDLLKKTAEESGIEYDLISENIEKLKNYFFTYGGEYIPLQICFLPYRDKIGQKRYIEYRRLLLALIKEKPRLIEKVDKACFNDRVLARAALKYAWGLEYLTMYQNDEKMVRYCLTNDGMAIEYADKRFQQDREWVKYATLHSEHGPIMSLNCMKPYRKDKELVYLACKVNRLNFVCVDKKYRDDLALAKICMQQIENHNSIFYSLSRRLKDNKELAMFDLQEDHPHSEYYSARLRDDDEIAEKLYELHGTKSFAWYHMSKRLRKKYGVTDD